MIINIEKYDGKQITYNDNSNEFVCEFKKDGADIIKRANSLVKLREKLDALEEASKIKQAKQPAILIEEGHQGSYAKKITFGNVGAFGFKSRWHGDKTLFFWFTSDKKDRSQQEVREYSRKKFVQDTPENREKISEVEKIGKLVEDYRLKCELEQNKILNTLAVIKPSIPEESLPDWN